MKSMECIEDAEKTLVELGYENVIVFKNYSYDSALIGVSTDNRAVYLYSKMVEWLMRKENMSEEDAIEWIDYNTVRALSYMGNSSPIIVMDLI